MPTFIHENTVLECDARTDTNGPWLKRRDFTTLTGYERKPEGFCRGAECVPVPLARLRALERADEVNLGAFAELTERPLVASRAGNDWLLDEPAAARHSTLTSLEAPDFALPDLAGEIYRLSAYRGRKVLLASWASW